MSQQTRIDQFYKFKSSKPLSSHAGKDKTNYTETKDTPVPSAKKAMHEDEDCVIIQEKINGTNTPLLSVNNNTSMKKMRMERTYCEIVNNNVDDIYLIETPKKTTALNSSFSEKLNYSPTVQRLYTEKISNNKQVDAVHYINLRKQGAIPPSDFNLEEIYAKGQCTGVFEYQYNSILSTKVETVYYSEEIMSYSDSYSQILINIILNVLSNPINCGFFQNHELDLIYSILTLPINAQALFVRMIKRKRGWHRQQNINYTDILADLRDPFEDLKSRSLCTFDMKNEKLSNLLELLQVDEVRRISKELKRNSTGTKTDMIKDLLKFSKQSQSFFRGAKSPKAALISITLNVLSCVRITDEAWNVIDKLIILLIPNYDPRCDLSQIFFMLLNVHRGKTKYPGLSVQRFPIFSTVEHLMGYIEAKSTLCRVYQFIEKKHWTEVCDIARSVMFRIPMLLQTESERLRNSALPAHIRSFMPGYLWLKVLSESIEPFKKLEDKEEAVEILNFLLEQDCHLHSKKGEWYSQLALIKMHHCKDIDASVSITIKAFETPSLTQVDKADLIERATKIAKRKSGVSSSVRMNIRKIIDAHNHSLPKVEITYTTVNADLMRGQQMYSKSIWRVESDSTSQSYGSVETVVLYHYSEKGFPHGLHCEGQLPIVLFFTLFWEELFDIHIPGAFVTLYQEAPQDLYTEYFYTHREERIRMKFEYIKSFSTEFFSSWMEDRFRQYNEFKSPMASKLITNSTHLKELVYCLGVDGVIGICKRLLENYKLWRSGFPDLIVWNYQNKDYKIIEVKGPKDTLSTKQTLWLQYLIELGLNAEVCLVNDKNSSKVSKRTMEGGDSSL